MVAANSNGLGEILSAGSEHDLIRVANLKEPFLCTQVKRRENVGESRLHKLFGVHTVHGVYFFGLVEAIFKHIQEGDKNKSPFDRSIPVYYPYVNLLLL